MKRSKKYSRYLIPGLILLVGLFLAAPLFTLRFIPTHDGEYHIIRFMEFFRMLESGYFFPRWAPTLNSGYGIPIFVFHYPFPNYIGALLHVTGFQFVDAFKIALAAGYLLSGLFCFYFLSRIFNRKQAAVGTVAAFTVPYWFVDIFVRGSVGEVWAMVWIFGALSSLVRDKKKLLAISTALLILSHNIMAMIFIPLITVFAFWWDRRNIGNILLGVLLSAYFWIPAIAERSFVQGLSTVSPLDHFASLVDLLIPSWGTEFSGNPLSLNKMSLQIGIIPLVWLVLAVWAVLRSKQTRMTTMAYGGLFILAVSVFLMLPVSAFIWQSLPFARYIQYPWRLLSFLIPVTAFFAAFVSQKISYWMSVLLLVVSMVLIYPYSRPVTYERRDDAYYSSRRNFTDGTSSLGNAFSTVWTVWKDKRATGSAEVTGGVATLREETQTPLQKAFIVDAKTNASVRINTLYYPGWSVREAGNRIPLEFEKDGLINFRVGPGLHRVDVRFGETPVRLVADAISIASLFWLVRLAILDRIYAHRNKRKISGRRA